MRAKFQLNLIVPLFSGIFSFVRDTPWNTQFYVFELFRTVGIRSWKLVWHAFIPSHFATNNWRILFCLLKVYNCYVHPIFHGVFLSSGWGGGGGGCLVHTKWLVVHNSFQNHWFVVNYLFSSSIIVRKNPMIQIASCEPALNGSLQETWHFFCVADICWNNSHLVIAWSCYDKTLPKSMEWILAIKVVRNKKFENFDHW